VSSIDPDPIAELGRRAAAAGLRTASTDIGQTTDDTSVLEALIRALEQQASDETKVALSGLRSIRGGYSDCLRRSQTTLRTDGYDPTVIRAVDATESPAIPDEPVPLPPPGASAEDANPWWKTLSPEQRSRLITGHRPELGNLNGIHVIVRSRVNRAVMNDDLHRVEDVAAQRGAAVDDVLRDPVKYGLTAGPPPATTMPDAPATA
jgi:hypothetical protein